MKKIKEIIMSNIYKIIGVAIIGLASWIGATFMKGHEVNKHQKFIVHLTSKQSVHIIDSLFELKSHEKINDFALIDRILQSPYVADYIRETSEELEKKIVSDYEKRDSLKTNMIHSLGVGTGIRNDEVMEQLIKLLKAFKEGKLYASRTVRGDF